MISLDIGELYHWSSLTYICINYCVCIDANSADVHRCMYIYISIDREQPTRGNSKSLEFGYQNIWENLNRPRPKCWSVNQAQLLKWSIKRLECTFWIRMQNVSQTTRLFFFSWGFVYNICKYHYCLRWEENSSVGDPVWLNIAVDNHSIKTNQRVQLKLSWLQCEDSMYQYPTCLAVCLTDALLMLFCMSMTLRSDPPVDHNRRLLTPVPWGTRTICHTGTSGNVLPLSMSGHPIGLMGSHTTLVEGWVRTQGEF